MLFRKFGWITVIAVYFLILVGGIVRSTGAGMGCPDWPKCFGKWVPPTEISQLPDNYLETITQKRVEKNKKFLKYVRFLGLTSLVNKLENHDVNQPIPFNVTKAWIEYLNRLVGVLIGFFIFLTLIFSLKYFKTDIKIVVLSFLAFILVGVEGFLGSIVVSTNLLPGLITIHMLLALIIVCLLIYIVARSVTFQKETVNISKPKFNKVLIINFIVMIIQLIYGTLVREKVDELIHSDMLNGTSLAQQLGTGFKLHFVFALVLLVINVWFLSKSTKLSKENPFRKYFIVIPVLVLLSFMTGILLYIFKIPGVVQPLHLVLSCIQIGLVCLVFIQSNESRIFKKLITKRKVKLVHGN